MDVLEESLSIEHVSSTEKHEDSDQEEFLFHESESILHSEKTSEDSETDTHNVETFSRLSSSSNEQDASSDDLFEFLQEDVEDNGKTFYDDCDSTTYNPPSENSVSKTSESSTSEDSKHESNESYNSSVNVGDNRLHLNSTHIPLPAHRQKMLDIYGKKAKLEFVQVFPKDSNITCHLRLRPLTDEDVLTGHMPVWKYSLNKQVNQQLPYRSCTRIELNYDIVRLSL